MTSIIIGHIQSAYKSLRGLGFVLAGALVVTTAGFITMGPKFGVTTAILLLAAILIGFSIRVIIIASRSTK